MALGGLAGIAFHQKGYVYRLLCQPYMHVLGWIVMVFSFAHLIPTPLISKPTLFGIGISIVLINQVSAYKNPLRLEHPWFTFLGKRSFGIYVYHPLLQKIIFVSYFQEIHSLSSWVQYLLYFSAILGATLIVASISYQWLEKPFLKLKETKAVIRSSADNKA